MEEKKATEVKCRTCEESKQVQNTQRFVLIGGGVFFFFGIYGIVSFIKDIISLFYSLSNLTYWLIIKSPTVSNLNPFDFTLNGNEVSTFFGILTFNAPSG